MPLISNLFQNLQKQSDVEYRKIILSMLERNPEAKLLDCGCGNGDFTLRVARAVQAKELYGIEAVDENIEQAIAKGIIAVKSDLNLEFPYKSESFDIVHANQVIEHLPKTDNFLREINRVLKNGGYALITTPNLAALHNIMLLLLGKQPAPASVSDEIFAGCLGASSKEIKTLGPAHQRIFTLSALSELLAYHGFEIEKSAGSGYYPLSGQLANVMSSIDKVHAAYITVKARKRHSRV
jgi:ubiquinone/menaquinone biosynthesis C-methylase UbiE